MLSKIEMLYSTPRHGIPYAPRHEFHTGLGREKPRATSGEVHQDFAGGYLDDDDDAPRFVSPPASDEGFGGEKACSGESPQARTFPPYKLTVVAFVDMHVHMYIGTVYSYTARMRPATTCAAPLLYCAV